MLGTFGSAEVRRCLAVQKEHRPAAMTVLKMPAGLGFRVMVWGLKFWIHATIRIFGFRVVMRVTQILSHVVSV